MLFCEDNQDSANFGFNVQFDYCIKLALLKSKGKPTSMQIFVCDYLKAEIQV